MRARSGEAAASQEAASVAGLGSAVQPRSPAAWRSWTFRTMDVESEVAALDTKTPADADMEIPADVAYVAFVRSVVSAAAARVPAFSEDRISDLALVVTEGATNAVTVHRKVGLNEPVRVRCWVSDDAVAVVIEDKGPGFDPDALPRMPPPESPERLRRESGLGVALMEMLADEADIRSGSEGTEVRLVLHASVSEARNSSRGLLDITGGTREGSDGAHGR